MSLVERAISYIEKTPAAISGNNGHDQAFALALSLVHGFCLDRIVSLSLLEQHYNPKCNPQWSHKELAHKVDSAINATPNRPRGWLLNSGNCKQARPVKIPSRQIQTLKVDALANVRKFLNGFRCAETEIIAASPYKLSPVIKGKHFHRQGAYLISMLYNKDDQVNIVSNQEQNENGKWHPVGYGGTLPRNEWLKRLLDPLAKRPGGHWVRMNPMDGKGISEKNVTAFRYALMEFDEIDLNLQLSLFARLPLPIVAIIYSGGRSYHAWIQINADDPAQYKETVAKLYDRMNRFGIDRSNKNASRMSRLPGVLREDQQQRLVYLNPEPSTEEIL